MSFTESLYPQTWQSATAMFARSPQALLLSGVEGLGKLNIVLELSQWLLCEKISPILKKQFHTSSENIQQLPEKACGHCVSCSLFAHREHQDFRLLYPKYKENDLLFWWGDYNLPIVNDKEDEKKAKNIISVKDIRALDEFVNLSAFNGGLRVAVVWPADKMHNAAANALLKTLEEPVRDLIFILVADNPRKLPATIISRCREIKVGIPTVTKARQWLQSQIPNQNLSDSTDINVDKIFNIAGGVPLQAITYLKYYPLIKELETVMGQKRGTQMLESATVIAEFVRAKLKKNESEDNINSGAGAGIGIESALSLFQRLIHIEIMHTIDRQNPHTTKKTNKLFGLLDEITFFKKHLVYNLNPRQVFERLLLMLLVVNKID